MIRIFECLPEKLRVRPLAVVLVTIANGMQPTFSGRRSKVLIISDLYRVIKELAEVHTDIARKKVKSIRSLLPQLFSLLIAIK